MRELDDPLGRALAEVRDEVAGYVRSPGSAAAMATLRRRRRYQTLVIVAVAVVLTLGLSTLVRLGGAGRSAPGGGPSHSPPAAAVWHEFVACARTHGVPDWPDPQVNPDGTASYPYTFDYKGHFDTVKGACASLLNQLPPQARPTGLHDR